MGRQKAADEVFCTSCGAAIKQAAEICPECGVRNDAAGQSGGRPAGTAGGRPGTGGTGQASAEPAVSANWWYGVALCLGLWVVVLALSSVGVPSSLEAFLGFLVLLAWIGLPVTAYYDLRYVRSHSDWQPPVGLWVIGFLVWVLNLVLGAVYLYRRHETIGTP